MNRDELVRALGGVGGEASRGARDDPSGLGDRGSLLEALSRARAFTPESAPLALVLLEPDQVSPAALGALGRALGLAAGPGGICGRWADHTFAWLLPGCDRAAGLRRAEGLRAELSATPIWVEGSALRIRLSLGVAMAPDDARGPRALVDAAALALEGARAAGGNQVADAARALGQTPCRRAGLERLGRAPIFGRDEALRQIADGLRGLREGQAHVLLLGAEPGFGRTSLLETVRRQLERRAACRNLFVDGSRPEARRPYSLLGRILRARLEAEPDGGAALVHALDEGEAEALRMMLVGSEPAADGAPAGPAEREAWFRGALGLLDRWLDDEPTALLLDELELADAASLLVLKQLLVSGSCPLFVCAGTEEGVRTPLHAFLDGHGAGLPIRRTALAPLGHEQIRGHLDVVFPGIDSEPLAAVLARTTGGSPLFLRLLLCHLLSEGRIRLDGRVWIWREPEVALPVSLFEVGRALLGQLSEADRRRLALLASFGEAVPSWLLAEAAGEAEPLLDGCLERARELALVRSRVQGRLEWVQPGSEALREVLLSGQPAQERPALHRRVLATLRQHGERLGVPIPASVVAYHEAHCAEVAPAAPVAFDDPQCFDPAEAASYAEVGSDRWEGAPLDPDSAEEVPATIRSLLTAVRGVRLYPAGSDTIGESFDSLERKLEHLLEKNTAVDVRLDAEGEGLEVNGEPLTLRGGRLMAPSLRDLLRRLELRALTLRRGLSRAELETAVRAIAEAEPDRIETRTWKRFSQQAGLEHVVLHQFRYARVAGAAPGSALVTGPAEGGEPESRDLSGAREVVRCVLALARGVELYPLRSQAVVELLERLLQSLEPELRRRPELTLAVAGDAVLVDGEPLESARFDPVMASFIELTSSRSLASLSFARGLGREELSRFVQALVEVPEGVDAISHWERASIQYGLEHVAGNQQVYATRAAAPVSLERDPARPAAAPASLATEPLPAPVIEREPVATPTPDSLAATSDEPQTLAGLLPELAGRLLEGVRAGEEEACGRLLRRAFGDFGELETLQREEVLDACRKAQRNLGLAYSRPLGRLLAPALFEALSLSDEPSVLGRCAELVQRLVDDLLQLREHGMARQLCEGLRERREQLEARGAAEAARALGRRLDATSRRLLLGDLAAGGQGAQDALRVLASQGVVALPWMAQAIASVEDRRLRTVLARQIASQGRPGSEALSRVLRDAKRPRERTRVLEVLELVVTRHLSREVALALADEAEEVRAAALDLATRVRDPEVLDLLLRQTGHPELAWALPAIDVLGDVRAYAATGCLLALLDAAHEPERVTHACRALGRIAAAEAFEPVAAVLGRRGRFRRAHSWPTTTRAAAANALVQIDPENARQRLREFADDEDPIIAFLAQDDG